MLRLLLRRLLRAIPILLGIVVMLFAVFNLLGDPARSIAGQRADAETLAQIRSELGLDEPWHRRLLSYLHDLSPLGYLSAEAQAEARYDFLRLSGGPASGALVLKWPYLGHSYQLERSVSSLYFSHLPGTLILALTSLLFAGLVGISLGAVAGMQPSSRLDRSLSLLSMFGVSAPSFLVGILLLWLLAIVWGQLTGLNVSGYLFEPRVFGSGDRIVPENLLLPALTLGIRPLAILFQLTRDSLISVRSQDYVRTARAIGLSPRRVLWRHSLRNALGPVATALTGWLAALLAGTFFVEFIFNWQGVGKLTIDALFSNDYPLLLGCSIGTGLLFVGINILMDLIYAWLDPRVRLA